MQVRAIDTGHYGSKRRDPGEEFAIKHRSDFSKNWMEAVGWTPEADPLDHDGDGSKGGAKRGTGLAANTIAELRAMAAEKNIDLGDAKSKADVIAAIELATEDAPTPDASDDGDI